MKTGYGLLANKKKNLSFGGSDIEPVLFLQIFRKIKPIVVSA
jgi:hypothetical protein